MTRVLITSLNYAPEETGIAPYSTALAEHLVVRGYDVSVVAGMPHYPQWRVDPLYARRRIPREIRNGVRVLRRAHFVPARQSALRRGVYEATSLTMLFDGLKRPKPDVVLGVVPSVSGGIVARAVAGRFGVPYGLIFQDLAGQGARQSGMRGGGVAGRFARLAEAWAARNASAIAIVAEGFRPYVESLGVDPSRIRRVRNWTRTGPATIDRATMRAQLGWPEDANVCLHAGNMGAKQGLANVIDAAKIAAAVDRRLLFVLMGDGSDRAALEAAAARAALSNLRFLPLQPAEALPSVLAAADLLLLNQRASVRDMSLPSKLTAYLASGRPVVAACAGDSETAREVEASGGGIVCAPDQPQALVDAIRRVTDDGGLALFVGNRGQAWARGVLSEESALRGYEQMVAGMLAMSGGHVHLPPAILDAARADSGDEQQERWAA